MTAEHCRAGVIRPGPETHKAAQIRTPPRSFWHSVGHHSAANPGGYTALRSADRGRDGVFAEYPVATTAIGTTRPYLRSFACSYRGRELLRKDLDRPRRYTPQPRRCSRYDRYAQPSWRADLEARNDPVGTAEPYATTGDVLFGSPIPLSVALPSLIQDGPVEALLQRLANVMAPMKQVLLRCTSPMRGRTLSSSPLLMDRGAMVDARDREPACASLHQAAGGGHWTPPGCWIVGCG